MAPQQHIPALETERLRLRAPQPKDVPAFAAFYRSDAARFVGGPLNEAQTWRYLCEVIGHWNMRGYGRWIVTQRDDDAALGLVGLHCPLDWPEPEVGWYIWAGSSQGYGSEAGRAARDYAYGTLGWTTLISLIGLENARSIRLAERLGAKQDGSFEHERFGEMGVWRHPSPETPQ